MQINANSGPKLPPSPRHNRGRPRTAASALMWQLHSEGHAYGAIADAFGITPERVGQLVRREKEEIKAGAQPPKLVPFAKHQAAWRLLVIRDLRQGFGVEDISLRLTIPVEDVRQFVRILRASGHMRAVLYPERQVE